MSFDIVIIGAGPAGLCFARSLKGSGLRIALVERQEEAALIAPADDGREIAITHHSQRLLRELGLWARLREEEIGALRDAMVLDGNDRDGLMFRHGEAGTIPGQQRQHPVGQQDPEARQNGVTRGRRDDERVPVF